VARQIAGVSHETVRVIAHQSGIARARWTKFPAEEREKIAEALRQNPNGVAVAKSHGKVSDQTVRRIAKEKRIKLSEVNLRKGKRLAPKTAGADYKKAEGESERGRRGAGSRQHRQREDSSNHRQESANPSHCSWWLALAKARVCGLMTRYGYGSPTGRRRFSRLRACTTARPRLFARERPKHLDNLREPRCLTA
jgi:hypothetical protein